MANTPLHLRRYFAQFGGPHRAVVESTGGWYWLADVLQTLGIELVLAHATRVKAISAAKVKTDKIDADVLAMLLRAELIPPAHMIAPERRGPRDVMRTRLRLVEKERSAQNSIARLLEKFNVDTVAALEDYARFQAQCHQAQIDLLGQQIHTLEAMLHPVLIPDADIQRLLWIPGIGKLNAFTIYTEIDGVGRSLRETVLFQLSPCSRGRQFGRTDAPPSGSKAGNRYLKLAFSHAAIRAMQYYPEIRAFYRAKARRKPVPIARTLVALELARIVYHVLTTHDDFNGCFKGRPLRRQKQRQWPRLASPAANWFRRDGASALDWEARRCARDISGTAVCIAATVRA